MSSTPISESGTPTSLRRASRDIDSADREVRRSSLCNGHMPTGSCNTSASPWPANVTTNDRMSDAMMPVVAVFLCAIIFFAIAGNVLVCVAVMTDRNLRKTSNYFIVSLAVSDALVAVLVMTFAVANDMVGQWMFGDNFCRVWMSFDVMCSTASILNLCAISLDRYVHIRNSLHYHVWVTSRRTVACIAGVWILSGLISFFPIEMGWHQDETPDDKDTVCLLELNPLYAVVSSAVSFYLPCLVMVLIYLRLYRYARIHVRCIREQTAAVGLYTADGEAASRTHHNRLSDHKAAITLGVIMGVFLFCWTPFFTVNVVGAFCRNDHGGSCVPPVLFTVFTWLGYFNSTLNPLIYSIFNQEFRDAFKRVLGVSCCARGRHRVRIGACQHRQGKVVARTNGASASPEYGSLTPVKDCYKVVAQDRVTSL